MEPIDSDQFFAEAATKADVASAPAAGTSAATFDYWTRRRPRRRATTPRPSSHAAIADLPARDLRCDAQRRLQHVEAATGSPGRPEKTSHIVLPSEEIHLEGSEKLF